MYVPEKDAMLWKIKNFPGGREFLMRCRFALPSVAAEEVPTGRMPPIRVNFEIPYLTVSGIQVRCLAGLAACGQPAGSVSACDCSQPVAGPCLQLPSLLQGSGCLDCCGTTMRARADMQPAAGKLHLWCTN